MYPAPFASYVLLERLGTGGMSEVDLARRSLSGANYVRLVVIKRIKADRAADESFVRMFKDEARITGELDHPNIGRVYDFGQEGDEYYLVLEYVAGLDLRQLITDLAARRQRVPLRIALGILVRVLDALDHAHRKRDALGRPMSVVHRDVNPRNVMLSVRGDVKLIDFGVALAEDRLERTRTDHVKGKFSYMAPEQISGEKVDQRADLYSVGLTLHELLTGSGPYAGLNQIQILHRMMSGELPKFPPVPELPDPSPLVEVHRKALQKDRTARYQTAAEFRDALLDVLTPLGGLPTSDDLAGFLRRTAPDVVAHIEAKIEAYSGGLPAPVDPIEDPSSGSFSGPPESTIDRGILASRVPVVTRPRDDSGSVSRVRPVGVVAGGVLLGSVVGVSILVLLVGVIALVSWGLTREPGLAVSSPVALEPAPITPMAEPAPRPGPVVAAPRPEPGSRPTPPPPPVPEPPVIGPVPTPQPMPVAAPTPMPAAAPVDWGTVNVGAERGHPIRVDGVLVGQLTPAMLRLPVGVHSVEVDGFAAKRVTVLRNQIHTLKFLP